MLDPYRTETLKWFNGTVVSKLGSVSSEYDLFTTSSQSKILTWVVCWFHTEPKYSNGSMEQWYWNKNSHSSLLLLLSFKIAHSNPETTNQSNATKDDLTIQWICRRNEMAGSVRSESDLFKFSSESKILTWVVCWTHTQPKHSNGSIEQWYWNRNSPLFLLSFQNSTQQSRDHQPIQCCIRWFNDLVDTAVCGISEFWIWFVHYFISIQNPEIPGMCPGYQK